jgi:hypothetical protein
MKRIGLGLITLAFLGGAWLAVLDPVTLDWPVFVSVVVVGAAGAVMVRVAHRSHHGSEETVRANTAQLRESLDAVVRSVESIRGDRLEVYAVSGAIDQRVLDHLNRFVSVRDTMKVAYGLPGFAAVMGPYAGGERYLNRVWSASADGYVDEVEDYLGRALEQFRLAREALRSLESALDV